MAAASAAALLYVPLALGCRAGGLFADSVAYLFMADVLSPWGARTEIAAQVYAESRFPPLFPALLGLFGAGSRALPAAHVFQALVLVAAAAASAAWAARACRSAFAGLAVGLAFAFSAATVRVGLEIASEPLFVLLLVATFAAVERRASQPIGAADIIPGLLAGALLLTREAGVLMLPALLPWAWQRRSRWAAVGLGVAALEWLGWHALRAGYSQFTSYTSVYATILDPAYLARWLGAASTHLREVLVDGWLDGAAFAPGVASRVAGALLTLAALPAAWRGLQRGEPVACFVALYFVGVLFWPYPTALPRLLMPLVVPCAVLAWRSLAADRARALLAATLVLAPTALGLPRLVSRATLEFAPALMPFRGAPALFDAPDAAIARESIEQHALLVALTRAIPDVAPPEQRVCAVAAEFVTLGAQRPVRRIPLGVESVGGAAWLARWCDQVFVTRFAAPQQGLETLYPAGLMPQPIRPALAAVDEGGLMVGALVPLEAPVAAPRIIRKP